jgi:hypothetical protein
MKGFSEGLFVIGILCILLCVNGCTTSYKSCINERTNQTIIRWGDYVIADGTFHGYEYRAQDLGVYTVQKQPEHKEIQFQKIDTVQAQVFCMRLNTIIDSFSEIQSLYSPGTIGRSIEYINQKTMITKKAIWNPLFQTYGSKEFRAIYDSLMQTVSVKNRWPDTIIHETVK